MKKGRILNILPEIDGGGVGAVVYNYVKAMPLNDFEVDLIVFDTGSKQLWSEELINLGIRIYYITPRTVNIKKHFKEVNKIIKNGKYDIVHAHMSEWASVYCYIALINDVRIRIGHSHIAGSLYSAKKRVVLKVINQIFKKSCNYYFSCGKNAGEYLWGLRAINENKVYIMNNAVSKERFGFNEEIRNKLKYKNNLENKLVFGSVGRFNEQKNHMFLIEVFKRINEIIPNSRLILIGDGELKEKIIEKIKKENLEEKVSMVGKRKDVNEWLNVFDLLLLPSLYEGLPVIGIESQMNGLPLLVSEGVTQEINILDTSYRLSLDDNIEKWAAKSIELAGLNTNRVEAQKIMKKRGYDIDEEASKLAQFYKSVLSCLKH